jgi:hypothetical protein
MAARTAVAGGIIYVDANAAGADNGTSWESAYVYLQDALADAEAAEKPLEIRVAQGIYKPDQGAFQTPGDREATFQLINNVTLSGGYAGHRQPDPNNRDITLYETILSGDLMGDDIDVYNIAVLFDEPKYSDNSYHVVVARETDSTAVLDGFTITAGNANGPVLEDVRYPESHNFQHGAGIYGISGNPTLINCTFSGNLADSGGCMFNYNNNPTLTDCTFSDNTVVSLGGGLFNYTSNPILTNCNFSKNSATKGGGIYNYRESCPILTNCTFSDNTVGGIEYGYGGGMFNSYSDPVLNKCTFSGNLSNHDGGGMRNFASDPTLTNCIFIRNSAGGGGGMINGGSNPILTNCMFIGNMSRNGGGGIENQNSDPLLTKCIFNGNQAKYGGGMYNGNSDSILINCSFSGNEAETDGGGIYIYPNSDITIINSTFAGNLAINGDALCCDSTESRNPSDIVISNCIFWNSGNEIWNNDNSTIAVNYSNIRGGWPGQGNIDVEPLFVNADEGDYHLKSQAGRWNPNSHSWIRDDVMSPCIDAGDPNTPVGDEPEPNGGIINMGAFGGTQQASISLFGFRAEYARGIGTPNHPYLIYTAEQMNTIGTEPDDWDKHFKLMADIDLSAYGGTDFNIIGQSYDNPFDGCIEGNGHTIDRFTFIDSSGQGVGLIGYLGPSGCVRNLVLTDSDVEGQAYVGCLVGYSRGIVRNCRVRGTARARSYTGGIVGISISDGLITDCHADVNVSGNDEIGGIAGANSGSTISFCSAKGSVAGSETTGGITGRQDDSVMHDCYSGCFVSGTYRAIGGLLGRNHSGVVSRCYSTGIVAGTDRVDGVGGLVGENFLPSLSNESAIISQSFSSGDVSGFTNIGGLVGINCGTIANCYATGSVYGEDTAGGLAGQNGYLYGQEVYPGNIFNCYSTGSVLGGVNVGGLTGYSLAGEIGNSFWDIQTSGWVTSSGGTGQRTAEMQMAGIFLNAGWDFLSEPVNGTEDIWWILEGQDYPRLWWEPTDYYLFGSENVP